MVWKARLNATADALLGQHIHFGDKVNPPLVAHIEGRAKPLAQQRPGLAGDGFSKRQEIGHGRRFSGSS